MNLQEQRRELYISLLLEAQDRWATLKELNGNLSYEEDNLTELLDTLVVLREIETTAFDDGIPCYKLTDFGLQWSQMMLN